MIPAGISAHLSSPLDSSILTSRPYLVHHIPNNVPSLPRNRNPFVRCPVHPLCNLVSLYPVLAHKFRARIIRYYLQQPIHHRPFLHLPFISLAPPRLRDRHRTMSLLCPLQVHQIALHDPCPPRSHGQSLCHLPRATSHNFKHQHPHDRLF